MTDAQWEQLEFLARTVEVPDDDGLRALREAGEIWRLRDELRRAVGLAHNARNLENCGRVLLEMGDAREAGIYLFWSGARKQSYAKAIELFWEREGRSHAKELRAASLQSQVCLPDGPDELNPVVLEELATRGVTWEELKTLRAPETAHSKLKGVLSFIGCSICTLLTAICLGLGARVIWQFLSGR